MYSKKSKYIKRTIKALCNDELGMVYWAARDLYKTRFNKEDYKMSDYIYTIQKIKDFSKSDLAKLCINYILVQKTDEMLTPYDLNFKDVLYKFEDREKGVNQLLNGYFVHNELESFTKLVQQISITFNNLGYNIKDYNKKSVTLYSWLIIAYTKRNMYEAGEINYNTKDIGYND